MNRILLTGIEPQFDILTFQLTVTDVCGIAATDTISLTVLRK